MKNYIKKLQPEVYFSRYFWAEKKPADAFSLVLYTKQLISKKYIIYFVCSPQNMKVTWFKRTKEEDRIYEKIENRNLYIE